MLDCPHKPGWHCPSFYLLYVDVDRLSMLLMRLHCLLALPITGLDDPSLKDVAEDVHGLLQEVSQRQKAIVGKLWQMYRATAPTLARQALHDRVGAHIPPKSGWYQTFMQHYGANQVANNSSILMHTALPIDTRPSGERVDFNTAECMLRWQAFDISTSQARLSLACAIEAARERVGGVLARMGEHLLAHCRIEDLLHPSSR